MAMTPQTLTRVKIDVVSFLLHYCDSIERRQLVRHLLTPTDTTTASLPGYGTR
jgi:hypothetical protein